MLFCMYHQLYFLNLIILFTHCINEVCIIIMGESPGFTLIIPVYSCMDDPMRHEGKVLIQIN